MCTKHNYQRPLSNNPVIMFHRGLQSFSMRIQNAGQDLSGLRTGSIAVTRAAAAAAISAATAGESDTKVQAAVNMAARAASAIALEGRIPSEGAHQHNTQPFSAAVYQGGVKPNKGPVNDDGVLTVVTNGATLALMLSAVVIMFVYVNSVGALASQAMSR